MRKIKRLITNLIAFPAFCVWAFLTSEPIGGHTHAEIVAKRK